MTREEEAAALVVAWEKAEGVSMRDGPTFTLERLIVKALRASMADGMQAAAQLVCIQCGTGAPIVFEGCLPHHKYDDGSTGYCSAGEILLSAREMRREK